MLTAMTTGHEGSLSTLHASSPGDAIRRVQTLALMGDLDLPYRAVADQVASALDVVVHQARHPDGVRRVVEIAAVGAVRPTGRCSRPWCAGGARTRRAGFEWSEGAARWLDGLVDVVGDGGARVSAAAARSSPRRRPSCAVVGVARLVGDPRARGAAARARAARPGRSPAGRRGGGWRRASSGEGSASAPTCSSPSPRWPPWSRARSPTLALRLPLAAPAGGRRRRWRPPWPWCGRPTGATWRASRSSCRASPSRSRRRSAAGLSLRQALTRAARDAPEPARAEFVRAVAELELGTRLETALEGAGRARARARPADHGHRDPRAAPHRREPRARPRALCRTGWRSAPGSRGSCAAPRLRRA